MDLAEAAAAGVLEDLAVEAALSEAVVQAEAGKFLNFFVCFALKLFGGFCKIDVKLNTFITIFSIILTKE